VLVQRDLVPSRVATLIDSGAHEIRRISRRSSLLSVMELARLSVPLHAVYP
jgi:hypothetical protein